MGADKGAEEREQTTKFLQKHINKTNKFFNLLKTMKKLFLVLAVVAMVFSAAIDVNAAPKKKSKKAKAKVEVVDKAAEAAKAK